MDYSTFCDDNFDLQTWVNNALQSEQNPNTLVMKLQLLMQEVNSSLEDSTTSLLSDIPRVVTEIQGLNNEAVLLRNQMSLVKCDINKVQEETSESMSSVVRLDKIKDRMLCTKRKLKQADNWCILNDQIDQLFEDQDLEGISEKLSEMRSALGGLVNLPDYEARCDRVNSLSNRLEAVLSPRLISTFNGNLTTDAVLYYKIFTGMGRRDELYNYYYRTHRTNTLKHFTNLRSTGSVEQWLNSLYGGLLELYHSQVSWTSEIYEDHQEIVLKTLIHCMEGVDLSHEIGNYIQDAHSRVTSLQCVMDITDRFAHSLHKECSTTSTELREQLGRSILHPYTKHLVSLGDLIKSSLLRDVHSLNMRIKRTSSDSISELYSSTKRVISHVRDYIPLSLQLTNTNTIHDVTAAIEFYFDLLIEKVNTFIKDLRSAFGVDLGSNATFQEDHWIGFQSCFKLFQVLGECYLEIVELEKECITQIQNHSSKGSQLLDNINIYLESNPSKYSLNNLLLQSILDKTATSLFSTTLELFKKPINSCNKLCIDFVLCHVKTSLTGIHLNSEWAAEEGAVFSPSPLTYITNLGDYLLLLPQQLEPFFTEENEPLDTALKLVDFTEYPSMGQDVEGDAFAWLTCVCQSTMFTVVEMILKIQRLTGAGCKQLSADVGYISNVMGALEVPLSRDIQDISRLLTLPVDKIEGSDTQNIPKYLRGKIATMRRSVF